MVEKRNIDDDNDEDKNKFYKYGSFGYIKRIQKSKKEYIQKHDDLTEKVQDGLRIHLEFHYLLNTDIDWIIKLVRDSMIEVFNEYQLKNNIEPKKPAFFTLNIEQVSTEKCIDFLFILGVIPPEYRKILETIGLNFISNYLYDVFKKLKNKNPTINGRDNLKRAKCTRTKYIRHKDGSIEYIKEIDEFEFYSD